MLVYYVLTSRSKREKAHEERLPLYRGDRNLRQRVVQGDGILSHRGRLTLALEKKVDCVVEEAAEKRVDGCQLGESIERLPMRRANQNAMPNGEFVK